VAAAVILSSFFDSPGAAVLVKPWRPQAAAAGGSRQTKQQPARQQETERQEQQQPARQQDAEQQEQDQDQQHGQQHEAEEGGEQPRGAEKLPT
jgi:hypothetical protein